ncbi:serine hydrolase [Algoriphagus aestuarii]|nr:serine hydrolase [Algoriphagus aestuarii]
MNHKFKILLAVLASWFILFLILDWWRSFPKIKITTLKKTESVQDKIDSVLLASISAYTLPGLALGVVQDGKIIYQKGFGFQSLSPADSFSTDSKFPSASISKLFTSLAAAHYWSSKGIAPQDLLAMVKISNDPQSELEQLSISDFLLHQTGLKDPGIIQRIFSSGKELKLKEYGEKIWRSNFQKPDSLTKEYSDANFDVLGYLIQEDSGVPFEEYLKEQILIPAGMEHSFFATQWPYESNTMTGYQETFVWKRIEPRRLTFKTVPSPSSGLVSTIHDFNLFLIHLSRGKMGIFQNELEWLSPFESSVPFGFQKISLNDQTWIGHYGGQAGYSSLLIFSPETKTGLILLANSRDTKDFRKHISSQVLQVLSPKNQKK